MNAAKVLRKAVKQFFPRNKAALYRIVSHIPLGQGFLRWYHQNSLDAHILSFPKCGRTRLRMILERALALHFGLEQVESLKSNVLLGTPGPHLPVIKIIHDDHPQFKTPDELTPDKTSFRSAKVMGGLRTCGNWRRTRPSRPRVD